MKIFLICSVALVVLISVEGHPGLKRKEEHSSVSVGGAGFSSGVSGGGVSSKHEQEFETDPWGTSSSSSSSFSGGHGSANAGAFAIGGSKEESKKIRG